MLALLNILGPLLGTKFGKVLVGGLLVAGIGAVVLAGMKAAEKQDPPPIASLLQEVQYMEELELVKFYSSHVMTLGNPNQLLALANKARQDTVSAQEELSRQRALLVEAEAIMEAAQENMEDLNDSLAGLTDSLREENHRFDELRQDTDDLIASLLEKGPGYVDSTYGMYGGEFAKLWKSEFAPVFGDSDQVRKKVLRKTKKAFKKGVRQLKKVVRDQEQELDKELKQRKKDMNYKAWAKDLEKKEKTYQKVLEDYNEAKVVLEEKRKIAQEAHIAAQKAVEEGNSLEEVKLLSIVPASVTAYIDLEKVNYEMVGLDSVVVTVDSVRMDPALVTLDSSKHYYIGDGTPEVSLMEGGLYRELFEQIRYGVGTIKKEAAEKAIKEGIIEEACFASRDYFNSLMLSFGYNTSVRFSSGQCSCLEPQKDETIILTPVNEVETNENTPEKE